ncbi:MmcQ/YjbR family DNA-binding protein [bacterium]|nr:MmcQ/YjbR family DNA-binding protein [bacterium]
MVSADEFSQMALSLPGVYTAPHFERTAYRTKKRIFATHLGKQNTVNIKLNPVEQSTFCDIGGGAVEAVNNKWGLQGWTQFNLQQVVPQILADALAVAHEMAQ